MRKKAKQDKKFSLIMNWGDLKVLLLSENEIKDIEQIKNLILLLTTIIIYG